MEENKIVNEVKKTVEEKVTKINSSLKNIEDKKNKFLFCVPSTTQPSASVYELYYHAYTIKKMGYPVYMLVENKDFETPKFIENKVVDLLEHVTMEKSNISVGPEDFMIIPETFTTVMEQTKSLPCKRIVFLQSLDYMLSALVPGVTWRDFEIKDVICTTKTLEKMLVKFYGLNYYNIKKCRVGIPDYFSEPVKPKKPIISIIGRNSNDISKVVKLFYAKYPHFSWVTFDPMLTRKKPPESMRRVDFAERLKDNFAAVWVDRISSFGTFPLECMATKTIPICLKPDITPEYLFSDDELTKFNENIGFWTTNMYDIPDMIGDVLTKFLDDSIPKELYDGMLEISNKYTQTISEKEIVEVYTKLIQERKETLNEAVESINK